MTVSTYLYSIASDGVLRDSEKAAIQRSIATLQQRLNAHFGTQVQEHFVFGSYSRGTILPRAMDEQSDVDYMVVFSDGGLQPQSYLERLIRFSEVRYSRSEVAQSHPTAVLELNHIRFELVPALRGWFGDLQIPARRSNYTLWQDTNPTGFNERLTQENKARNFLTKRLVRILKYWNAQAGYPFESYALEQMVTSHPVYFFGLAGALPLAEYFYQVVDGLSPGWSAPQWVCDAVTRLKETVSKARTAEREGNILMAEKLLARVLPPLVATPGLAALYSR